MTRDYSAGLRCLPPYDTPSRRFTFSKDADFELVQKMKQAGIKLGIGTDLVRDWFRYLPAPDITELPQFVRLGYPVPEVLQIATRTNAQMLDMGDTLGTLESGKRHTPFAVPASSEQDRAP